VQVFQFRPGQLEVEAGTRVTWTNGDDIMHTVTSGTPEQRDGRFAPRLEGRGAAASVSSPPPGCTRTSASVTPRCAARSA
jgi:plastocyanin